MAEQMKTVHWSAKNGGLNQAINSGLEFSVLSEDDHQCMPFAYCKDYLQDAIQGCVNNKTVSIYGYTYNPKAKHKPALSKARLLLCNSQDSKFRNKIANCLDFINQFEEKLDIAKTIAIECKKPAGKYSRGGVWLFEGSRRWIKSPVMISLYSLLLRVGFAHKAGKTSQQTINDIGNGTINAYQPIDKGRLSAAKKGIDKILKYGDRNIFYEDISKNYPKNVLAGTMHNYCGIVGFSSESSKTAMPHWYRALTKTLKKTVKSKTVKKKSKTLKKTVKSKTVKKKSKTLKKSKTVKKKSKTLKKSKTTKSKTLKKSKITKSKTLKKSKITKK